eukprot:scaffold10090_cov119-Cylindrotheca_fusiformis.AAC.5
MDDQRKMQLCCRFQLIFVEFRIPQCALFSSLEAGSLAVVDMYSFHTIGVVAALWTQVNWSHSTFYAEGHL